jgi:sugar fermentation stimulation protein A
MELEDLKPAVFLKRRQRFFADLQLPDGTEITAHCPNTGSMLSLLNPGCKAWYSTTSNANRKLPYTLELLESPQGSLCGVNTHIPNAIVKEAIITQKIPELLPYTSLRSEVRYGTQNSRIDILLESPTGLIYVEVKNVTLMQDFASSLASFPDAVTSRGLKHLEELGEMVRLGHRGVIFFLVNREDARSFTIASQIDKAYATAFKAAVACGVEVLIYQTTFRRSGSAVTIEVGGSLPLIEHEPH